MCYSERLVRPSRAPPNLPTVARVRRSIRSLSCPRCELGRWPDDELPVLRDVLESATGIQLGQKRVIQGRDDTMKRSPLLASRRPRQPVLTLLLGGLAITVTLLTPKNSRQTRGAEAPPSEAQTDIPALGARAPARTETATFAAG
jgi:hypothetical protein